MKISDLRELKTEELHAELDRLRHHAFDLRSQKVTEKLEDPSQLGKARRDIARVLTVLSERGERNIEQQQIHLEARGGKRSAKKATKASN